MEILFDYRLRVTALLIMTLLLIACSPKAETIPSATSTQENASDVTALTASEIPLASDQPLIASALTLEEATPQQVQIAFESADFVSFDNEPREDGTPHIVGYHAVDDVAVGITGSELAERVQVADFSGGLEGTEEFNFLIRLFVPSAEEWLTEQINTALANPALDYEAQSVFGDTAVMVAALNTDDGRQMRVYVEPAP